MSEIDCPACGRDDQVQSVQSIVMAGTSREQYNGTGFGFAGNDLIVMANTGTGMSQTVLARHLSPPPKPQASNVAGAAFFSLFPLFFGSMFIYGGLQDGGMLVPVVGGVLVLIGLLTLLGSWLVYSGSAYKRDREMPAWERALNVWGIINYCHRCSAISVPHLPRTYYIDTSVEALNAMADDLGVPKPPTRPAPAKPVKSTAPARRQKVHPGIILAILIALGVMGAISSNQQGSSNTPPHTSHPVAQR